jgi:hypothetical protein
MTVGAVVGIEAGQIQLLDRVHNRPHQMVPGHPPKQRREHQKRLLTTAFDEVLGHAGNVLTAPEGTPFPDSLVEEQHSKPALLPCRLTGRLDWPAR